MISILVPRSVRDMFALPGLINSEPSMLNEVTGDNPPSLFERIGCLARYVSNWDMIITLFVH